MRISTRLRGIAAAFAILVLTAVAAEADQSPIETALTNIMTLHRPGQDGLATVWDGNKYVQCRLQLDRALRCEAAGTLMQPSLARVLSPDRIAKLQALGWTLDSSFGNYVQIFPSELPVKDIAERLLQALREGYDANIGGLEVGREERAVSAAQRTEPESRRHDWRRAIDGRL